MCVIPYFFMILGGVRKSFDKKRQKKHKKTPISYHAKGNFFFLETEKRGFRSVKKKFLFTKFLLQENKKKKIYEQ